MNAKIFTYNKEFLSIKDNNICLFFPNKNEKYSFFKLNSIEDYDIFVFIYYNTFGNRVILYVENFTITEFMDTLDNEAFIYGIGKNIKQIDIKELSSIKRKMVIQNLLN